MTAHARLRVPVGAADHIRGPEGAPIEVVEYGDYGCPHCARAYPVLERLQEALAGEMRFIYRHLPITATHPEARNAARAAEAAGRQNKFWDMHALLFRNQPAHDPGSLISYASALGLDMDQWLEDMDGEAVRAKVDEDFQGGIRSGANGTPAFFVNGYRYDGDWAYGPFLEALKEGAPVGR